jgi:hypothetical protein
MTSDIAVTLEESIKDLTARVVSLDARVSAFEDALEEPHRDE